MSIAFSLSNGRLQICRKNAWKEVSMMVLDVTYMSQSPAYSSLFNRRIYVTLIISLSMRRQTEAACQ